MNSLLRLFLLIFLGVPAGALWCAGIVAVVMSTTALWMAGTETRIPADAFAAISAGIFGGAAASAIGWLMMMGSVVLSSGSDYRVDAKRLAPCAGLEITVGLMSALALSCLIATGSRWKWEELGPAWLPAIAGLLLASSAIWLGRHAAQRRKEWKAELRALHRNAP